MRSILYVISFLLCSTFTFASDCKVIEYPDRNEVVCEGVQENKSSNQDNTKSPKIMRAEFLSREIDRLIKDGEAAMKRTGNESIEELKLKRAVAVKNLQQMEIYVAELKALKDQAGYESEALKKKFAEDNKRFKKEHSR